MGPDDIVNSGVAAFARAISDGVAAIIKTTITWWIDVPSIDLAGESNIVEKLRFFMLPLAVFVAVAGVIYSGIRMTLTRKADPLIDIGRGLFMTSFWGATGVALPAAMLQLTDQMSSWVLDSSTGGKFGERMTVLFSAAAFAPAPGVTIALGFAVILGAALQAVLMIFREGSIIILCGVIVFAAAGQYNPITKPWLRKVTSWWLALIWYKFGAALVYATAFVMIGEGKGIRALFMGFAMLFLSIGALPALMKFFNWAVGAIDSGGGGMAGVLGAAGSGMHAMSWGKSGGGGGNDSGGGGSDAAEHARFIQQSMSSQSGSAPTGASSTVGSGTSSATAAAPQAASTVTAGSSTAAASTGTAAASTGGAAAAGTGAAAGGGAAAAGGTAAAVGGTAAAGAATGGAALVVAAGVAAVGVAAKAAGAVKDQALNATEGN